MNTTSTIPLQEALQKLDEDAYYDRHELSGLLEAVYSHAFFKLPKLLKVLKAQRESIVNPKARPPTLDEIQKVLDEVETVKY